MSNRIHVQNPSHVIPKNLANRTLATLCFYYPAYTLAEARKIPYRDVLLLLDIARKERSKFLYDLTQIAAAPQTEKGKGVKMLSEFYMGQADG